MLPWSAAEQRLYLPTTRLMPPCDARKRNTELPVHTPLHDPTNIVLTRKTFLRGSIFGLTLKLMSILKCRFLCQTASFQFPVFWELKFFRELISSSTLIFFFFIFLLGFWSIFKFSPHIFLFRHSIEFSTYCRSIWKFSCRMVKTGESYKQLEVEFWKETPTNPKLKLSTALQSSIMPTASSDYLSS